MAVTGRTGADAIARSAAKSIRTLNAYARKFDAVIDAAIAAGAITADEGLVIRAYVTSLTSAYTGLIKLAAYSGF